MQLIAGFLDVWLPADWRAADEGARAPPAGLSEVAYHFKLVLRSLQLVNLHCSTTVSADFYGCPAPLAAGELGPDGVGADVGGEGVFSYLLPLLPNPGAG